MAEVKEWRGIRGLVCAEVLTDNADGITFGEVFDVAGVSKLTRNTATSSETHYYDNNPAIVIDSTGADTVTVDASAIPFDVTAKITGQHYDEKKGMYVEGERSPKYYAMGYITEKNDGTEVFVWRLKGKFNVPDTEHGTKNDGTDATGQQLIYTGINTAHKFDIDGKKKTAKAVNIDTSVNTGVTEETFFDSVKTPDDITVVA